MEMGLKGDPLGDRMISYDDIYDDNYDCLKMLDEASGRCQVFASMCISQKELIKRRKNKANIKGNISKKYRF